MFSAISDLHQHRRNFAYRNVVRRARPVTYRHSAWAVPMPVTMALNSTSARPRQISPRQHLTYNPFPRDDRQPTNSSGSVPVERIVAADSPPRTPPSRCFDPPSRSHQSTGSYPRTCGGLTPRLHFIERPQCPALTLQPLHVRHLCRCRICNRHLPRCAYPGPAARDALSAYPHWEATLPASFGNTIRNDHDPRP